MATTVTFCREIARVRDGYRWRLIATFAGDMRGTQTLAGRCITLVGVNRRLEEAEATIRREVAQALPPADLLDTLETAPGDGARRDGEAVLE